ncbi:hypothetical protein BpHYR1_017262 [Brachionus plicatilis]|uniref:Uncharacterized protein n=1 Tax=Brachionus plicatilis TaxID=10195 RepID=A0A3M7QF99_BRAPC|nr:hypothetical protein BpHYR1_017262 [Brachionus plicatilis]
MPGPWVHGPPIKVIILAAQLGYSASNRPTAIDSATPVDLSGPNRSKPCHSWKLAEEICILAEETAAAEAVGLVDSDEQACSMELVYSNLAFLVFALHSSLWCP